MGAQTALEKEGVQIVHEGKEVGERNVHVAEEIAHVREGVEEQIVHEGKAVVVGGQTVHVRQVVVVGGLIVHEEEGAGGRNKVSFHSYWLPKGHWLPHLLVESVWRHLVKVYLMRHGQLLCLYFVQFLVSWVHFD